MGNLRFSKKRLSGLNYSSFETVLMIGRTGTFELQNDKAGRDAFTEVARWVHNHSQKELDTQLELCVQGFPEQSDEEGDGRASVSVELAIGLVVGRAGYRSGVQSTRGYLAAIEETAHAVDEGFWEQAEEKLGIELATQIKRTSPGRERKTATLLVPAGVGVTATYVVGVNTKETPSKSAMPRAPQGFKLDRWGKIFGYGLYAEEITKIFITDSHRKKMADGLRDLGTPAGWLECLRV